MSGKTRLSCLSSFRSICLFIAPCWHYKCLWLNAFGVGNPSEQAIMIALFVAINAYFWLEAPFETI